MLGTRHATIAAFLPGKDRRDYRRISPGRLIMNVAVESKKPRNTASASAGKSASLSAVVISFIHRSPLFDITRGPAKPKYQKIPQTLLGAL
jgi:hypothetical protein